MLRAKGKAAAYTFGHALTGAATEVPRLISGGDLRGPVVTAQNTFYQVIFERPLEKGDRQVVELERQILDPGRTMKPFVSKMLSRSAGYGSLQMQVRFPDERPRQLFFSVHQERIGPLHEPVSALFLSQDGTAVVDVESPRAGYTYLISWVW